MPEVTVTFANPLGVLCWMMMSMETPQAIRSTGHSAKEHSPLQANNHHKQQQQQTAIPYIPLLSLFCSIALRTIAS